MFKNVAQLECTIDGKISRLICDIDCSTTILKEMLFQYQKYIGQVEDNAKAMAEKAESEKKVEAIPEVANGSGA